MDARKASFPSIFGAKKPGVPASTMKPLTLPSSLAQTSAMSAIGLLVIHVFVPLSLKPPSTATARAVSALRTLLPWTAPLVRNGGELALLKGANAENEITAAQKQIRKFLLSDVRVETLGEGVLSETTRVLRATVRG